MKKFWICLVVVFALFIGACGGSTEYGDTYTHETPAACVPGATAACWCGDDYGFGFQTCQTTGKFGDCECNGHGLAECKPDMICECETPRTYCWASERNGVLACEQGWIVPLDVVGSFTNEACADAGSPEASPVEDAGSNLLRVWMASEPVSADVKPNAKNVPVLGLNLQAYQTAGDVHISAIGISCRASIAGEAYEGTECWKRVDRVEILDENGQELAPSDSPDMVAGLVYYAVDYTVKKNQTRSLLVRADFGSQASEEKPFDKVSFDLGDLLEAETGVVTDDATVIVGHGFGLNQQGEEPKVEFTIVPPDSVALTITGETPEAKTQVTN